MDRPGDAAIQLYQCRRCGTSRACRPNWTTRCHVCLDERSTAEAKAIAKSAFRTLTDQPELFRRPGWTVLATDICGLPWFGVRTQPHSHGTWARHGACGAVAKLHPGTVDCPACGPELGSRTFLGRSDQPYLLYLVRNRRWQKFGVGDRRRVIEHLRGGAAVIQVLQAPFVQVIAAERALKLQHHDAAVRRVKRGMISSFGQGTEVTRAGVTIDLSQVLPDGEDVTHSFR